MLKIGQKIGEDMDRSKVPHFYWPTLYIL